MQSKDILDSIDVTEEDLGKSQMTSGDHYLITFARNNKEITFDYHGSSAFTSTVSDYIEALLSDKIIYESEEEWTVEEFRKEFGYEEKSDDDIEKIINQLKENRDKFDSFFTKEEVECLCKDLEW